MSVAEPTTVKAHVRLSGDGHGDAVVVSQRERSERTVAGILGAGRALMTEAGYAGVTVDDVTARAGVAKGAFYHHFPSKRALLDAVIDQLQGRSPTSCGQTELQGRCRAMIWPRRWRAT